MQVIDAGDCYAELLDSRTFTVERHKIIYTSSAVHVYFALIQDLCYYLITHHIEMKHSKENDRDLQNGWSVFLHAAGLNKNPVLGN